MEDASIVNVFVMFIITSLTLTKAALDRVSSRFKCLRIFGNVFGVSCDFLGAQETGFTFCEGLDYGYNKCW